MKCHSRAETLSGSMERHKLLRLCLYISSGLSYVQLLLEVTLLCGPVTRSAPFMVSASPQGAAWVAAIRVAKRRLFARHSLHQRAAPGRSIPGCLPPQERHQKSKPLRGRPSESDLLLAVALTVARTPSSPQTMAASNGGVYHPPFATTAAGGSIASFASYGTLSYGGGTATVSAAAKSTSTSIVDTNGGVNADSLLAYFTIP